MAKKQPPRNLRQKAADENQAVVAMPPGSEQGTNKGKVPGMVSNPGFKVSGWRTGKSARNLKAMVVTASQDSRVGIEDVVVIKRKPSQRQLAKMRAVATQTTKTINMLTTVEEDKFVRQRLSQRLVFLNMIANEKFAYPERYSDEDKTLYDAFGSLAPRQRTMVLNHLKDKYQGL